MNSINRYVLRQLLVGLILVSAGLTCVIWLTQSLRFVEMIVNKGVSAGLFVYLTMLMVPNFLAIVLPIALFTVVVFTYSKMTTDRELVVMRAAGMSQVALAKPALMLAGITMVIGYTLNLYLVPESYRQFRELQWNIRYSYSHVLLQEGAFTEISDGITVYVRERTKDGQLRGILVHDERKPERPSTWMAERGAMVEGANGARVVLFNGNRQQVDKKSMNLSVLYFDKNSFDLERKSNEGIVRYREARERSTLELFNLEQDKLLNYKDYGKFTVEAHKRITGPVSAIGYALIGLACLISGSFSRRNQTLKIILAVVVFVIVLGGTLALENYCAKNLKLIPLLYVNAIVPGIVAFFFMLKSFYGKRRQGEPPDDLLPEDPIVEKPGHEEARA